MANKQDALMGIETAITNALRGMLVTHKIGEKELRPRVGDAISQAGFKVDHGDTRGILASGLPVWRSKNSSEIEPTKRRRIIDLVAYDRNDCAVALIEVESDLDDLRQIGVSARNDHYDVFSIARSASGRYFDSYKSLERMAAAAFYRAAEGVNHFELPNRLANLSSDDPIAHNPVGLGLFLVAGRCRPQDRPILAARLASLNAVLLSPEASALHQ